MSIGAPTRATLVVDPRAAIAALPCERNDDRSGPIAAYVGRVTTQASAPAPAPAPGKRPQGGPFAFVGAFTGFYPAQASEFAHLDPVTRFLYAARSVILVISAQSAVMAGLLAATDRRFETLPFVLLFVAYLVLHAVSNLSNDYFGYRRGHDTDDSPRRRYTLHPIASGAVTPRLLAGGLVVLGVVSVAVAVYFVALRGWPAVWLTLIGGVLLYAYDAAPRALKELGLGEIAAFVVWGPLMIGGGYYVITGHWSGIAFAASVPPGLGVMSILVGKHVDQREFDTGQHQRTLPVVLGEHAARVFNQLSVDRDVRRDRADGRPRRPLAVHAAHRRGRAARAEGAAGHEPARPGRAAGGLRRLAALVPPRLPGPQPRLRLALHRRAGRRRRLARQPPGLTAPQPTPPVEYTAVGRRHSS